MLKIIRADGNAELRLVDDMQRRTSEVGVEVEATVRDIMEQVKMRGYDAVAEFSLRFDGNEPRGVSRDEIDAAYAECDPTVVAALERSAQNIAAYQSKLLVESREWSAGDGMTLGVSVRGLERVGIYVPGGTAAYPSSVLMNAVAARVAGVSEIIMVTPPTGYLSTAVLAAAKIAGVDKVFAVGGAQAIAALTYGAGAIPKVDKIVGPGNAYVAAAKRLAYGEVDIDITAGPSEILIIADDSANPAHIAADLLSQAEHDALASAVLVTDSASFTDAVCAEIASQVARLPRREIAQSSLQNFGAALVCDTLERACELANLIAPEHLEIATRNPRALLPHIKNAGAVFLGHHTPEAVGDYMAGPSHVLPTSGTARFFSPLSVDSFQKKMSIIEYSEEALREQAADIVAIARDEGFDAHARSVSIRMGERL